ncbi:GSCOCG00008226001-RA-CDS [Cotesia congregata]|uniref:Similar to Sec6: Exocyst complex component 3 (Drosophila melanogaster) n=1 Tax=Cotesia congregata TaxID=51543 RepID=A0A8J2E941_COTCN|nr:GSCOCG00008226001-RA-CDS [Cotesia congregata]CAG5073829.1 Similar to Sec6: Exocyst complex component 3 (Drosophila melanogaster) [Cotesia congregata]
MIGTTNLTDLQKLEEEAKATATKHVMNMLQRPGQLEKVEQYKRRITRKKASVETMLKTAMQSQLDGVRVGFDQLQTSLSTIASIKDEVDLIGQSFGSALELNTKLQPVQEENMRHSQYVTAKENLKHIFTVPESVEKTKTWINEGKLLHAHQSLMDLENSRDDLLYELHKLPNQSLPDKVMLKAYFEDVETLSQLMEKQIKLVLSRTLNTVRKEPTVIVTALRIIEREEKADQFAVQRFRQSGFMPPGRPKKWKDMAMQTLEKSVANRIEGTQVDERADNKMWLVRYLELTRQLIQEDLRVVKTLCGPCFPPYYDIVNKFVRMYHGCLSQHLKDIIANGLEGNEYVSLLGWIMNTYPGADLMLHPELNINISEIGDLLSKEILDELQEKYLRNMCQNYEEWMKKTLETEKADWWSGKAPESSSQDTYYHTAAPVIIFQMIDQNLQVTKTISNELTAKALVVCIEQVNKYGLMYRQAIMEFKAKHFDDRSQVPYFTHHMITVVNNCLQYVELAQQMKQLYWVTNATSDAAVKFENLLANYQQLRNEAVAILLEESLLDLETKFQDLLTPKWLNTSIAVETICVTLEDYFQDYGHLRVKNFEYVINEAQNLIAKRYIAAMLSRKISLKNYDECLTCTSKIMSEADKLKNFFVRIAPKVGNFDSPFEIIKRLAEVLRCEDAEILTLDLHSLVEKYPDMTDDHLVRLLSLRGDIPRSEAKEKVAYILEAQKNRTSSSQSISNSIFKQIVLQDSFLSWKP